MELAGRRLVIFGCGYLGMRVARRALEAGVEVTALTRNADQAGQLTRAGVQGVITADLDAAEWHPLLEPRQDFVLDCVSSAGGGLEGYRRSYLEGMRSILEWAARGEIGTLVFTSSTSVYAQDHGGWVTEADPADGSSEGGAILRRAETLLEQAPPAVARGFILRLGGIYGPDRHHLLDRALAESSGVAATAGADPFLNSIHVEDAVAAVWAAFRAGHEIRGGIFNIVDDQPAPKGEIVRYLWAQARERGLIPSVGQESRRPSRRRNGIRPNRKISNRKAKEILAWHPAYSDYRAGYEPLLSRLQARPAP